MPFVLTPKYMIVFASVVAWGAVVPLSKITASKMPPSIIIEASSAVTKIKRTVGGTRTHLIWAFGNINAFPNPFVAQVLWFNGFVKETLLRWEWDIPIIRRSNPIALWLVVRTEWAQTHIDCMKMFSESIPIRNRTTRLSLGLIRNPFLSWICFKIFWHWESCGIFGRVTCHEHVQLIHRWSQENVGMTHRIKREPKAWSLVISSDLLAAQRIIMRVRSRWKRIRRKSSARIACTVVGSWLGSSTQQPPQHRSSTALSWKFCVAIYVEWPISRSYCANGNHTKAVSELASKLRRLEFRCWPLKR